MNRFNKKRIMELFHFLKALFQILPFYLIIPIPIISLTDFIDQHLLDLPIFYA